MMVGGMEPWRTVLKSDPLPWLLQNETPAVRHLALRRLLDERPDSPAVRSAQAAAMRSDPIAAILAAQDEDGFFEPRHRWPKYRGPMYSLTFLHQAGADPAHSRVRRLCEYMLEGVPGLDGRLGPGIDWQVHCFHGNTLAALINFGFADDERVQRAIDWQARAITGDGVRGWPLGRTTGPGFACGYNGGLSCAWGAIKALLAFAMIPPNERSPMTKRAIAKSVEFLLSCDPAVADYPAGWPGKVSPLWFRLGFPSGYVADLLQNLEALVAVGSARDARLGNAVDFILSRQDVRGRWRNDHVYERQTWAPFDTTHSTSKWVTLRACTVLRAVLG
jgi:hypothetical protein